MKQEQHKQKDFILAWFQKALSELETGEEFYIPCHSKDHQKSLFKAFKKELQIFEKIDPMTAASLHIWFTFKDKRFWLGIRKIFPELSIGFKKDLEGKVTKTELNKDLELKRRISLMRTDGMSWEEIEEIEGEISSEVKGEVK